MKKQNVPFHPDHQTTDSIGFSDSFYSLVQPLRVVVNVCGKNCKNKGGNCYNTHPCTYAEECPHFIISSFHLPLHSHNLHFSFKFDFHTTRQDSYEFSQMVFFACTFTYTTCPCVYGKCERGIEYYAFSFFHVLTHWRRALGFFLLTEVVRVARHERTVNDMD